MIRAELNMAFHPGAKRKCEAGEIEFMPYKRIAYLADSVKENLPKHTQENFLAAFKNYLINYLLAGLPKLYRLFKKQ
ncbi:MAG: hypothetical protein V7K63_01950 [Nostoc sp.]